MEESIVRVSMRDDNAYDCSYAVVTKIKGDIQKSVVIILKDLECGIFDGNNFTDNQDFRFLLLKQYPNDTYALKDFYKLIGKMCHKSIESKYFLNPKEEYNRIKFIDFQTETGDYDYNDKELSDRFNTFKEFVDSMRKRITL